MMELENETKILIPPLTQFTLVQRGEFFGAQMNNSGTWSV
jgi:hypothetical protein